MSYRDLRMMKLRRETSGDFRPRKDAGDLARSLRCQSHHEEAVLGNPGMNRGGW